MEARASALPRVRDDVVNMIRQAEDDASIYREWERTAPNARIARYSRILAEAAENFATMCRRELREFVQPELLAGVPNVEIERLLENPHPAKRTSVSLF